MKKRKVMIAITVAVALFLALYALFTLWWNGAFDKVAVTDIANFESPDGSYCIQYQQIGDPEWPFGRTDVRLTLYDSNGHIQNSVDTFIADDGAAAHEGNIKAIKWTEDAVKIILQASEMPDKEIEIAFRK